MARAVVNNIGVCSGVGMLDEGLHLATGCRTVCHVERDSGAATALMARMEESSLEPAPIWAGNLEQFPARSFRDVVDSVSAGFPCQPSSTAGKRLGLEDSRWLWPSVADCIRESGAWCAWLENVPGLLTVDGGFSSVLSDLASMGFNAEWGVLSANAIGASHLRERVFILAYRRGITPLDESNGGRRIYGQSDQQSASGRVEAFGKSQSGSGEMAHAGYKPGKSAIGRIRPKHQTSDGAMADANGVGRWEQSDSGIESRANSSGSDLGNSEYSTARHGESDEQSSSPSQNRGGGGCSDLLTQAEYWMNPAQLDWPTPAARDHKGRDMPNHSGGASLGHAAETGQFSHVGQTPLRGPKSSKSARILRQRLNPAFVCWLMGWPWYWTRQEPISFGAAETALWRFKLQSLLESLTQGLQGDSL